MQPKPAEARYPARQVYSQIKCPCMYGLSLLIAAARIFTQLLHPLPTQLLDEKGDR